MKNNTNKSQRNRKTVAKTTTNRKTATNIGLQQQQAKNNDETAV